VEKALRQTYVLLGVVVAAYFTLGVLYAVFTPIWQAPDEPAHYNYVRSLAEGEGFPVLEPGDYDDEYISQLTTEGFPPELSVEPLEYEDHQPPFYYLLSVPLYLLFDGAVLPLRLLSIVLGTGTLVAAFGTVRAISPNRPALALFATGLIAFVPQRLALSAAVNNDALAELVVACTLWAAALYVQGRNERPWLLGLLLGLALLAKTTAYVAAGVAILALVLRWRRESRSIRWALRQTCWMLAPALILAGPWFVRNALTYGWLDPLGLARHTAVVEGQQTTGEFIADNGWDGLTSRFVTWTFQSFWGRFGWMAVFLPAWVYKSLALFSALVVAGFFWWLLDRRRPRLGSQQRRLMLLLLGSAAFTLLGYLWHNVTYLQHQGRYLFPALVPIATAAALGLGRLAEALPARVRPLAAAALPGGLILLDVYALFWVIVPILGT
jgi:4-amino-4-deoxy-L-arabinose transferase-like glycosyltransferase